MDPHHHAELGEAGRVMEPLQVGQAGHVDRRRGSSLLTVLGFGFLAFNSGMAIYRSKGDYTSIAFVVFSYLDLVLLFCYLRRFEREPAGSSRGDFIKVAVWSLTTLLTLMFAYKVAAVMPLPVAVLVWAMAFATALGFYAFFIRQDELAAV